MSWPLSDEINEAIQTPSVSFADPDLKGGQVVLGEKVAKDTARYMEYRWEPEKAAPGKAEKQ